MSEAPNFKLLAKGRSKKGEKMTMVEGSSAAPSIDLAKAYAMSLLPKDDNGARFTTNIQVRFSLS
jgi:hypothetical protein